MKKSFYNILILSLIVISSSLGIYLTLKNSNFMSTSAFYYYTIQSNIVILIISLIFIIINIFNIHINNLLYCIKYIGTIGITVTFIVFLLLLTPQIMITGKVSYLFTLDNITLHFISPLLSITSFIYYDKIYYKKTTYLMSVIMPICYMGFIYINSLLNSKPLFQNFNGTLTKYPYFFFDYETNGWFSITTNIFKLGSFYWIIILSIVVILLGKFLLFLNKKHNH